MHLNLIVKVYMKDENLLFPLKPAKIDKYHISYYYENMVGPCGNY